MDKLKKEELMKKEHAAWLRIVKLTENKSITITESDWKQPLDSPAITPGLQLIKAIKDWGANLKTLVNFTKEE